jgi:hypothetical protein
MANIRTKVKQMNDEISKNGGEKMQKWLHDSYNGSDDDIHSTKSFKIAKKSTSGIDGRTLWNGVLVTKHISMMFPSS